MIDTLTIDDFRPLIGQPLRLRFGDQTQTADVLSLSEHGTGQEGARKPFSLVIRSGPRDRFWPQGIYTLDHPGHGALDLFMVPIGPDDAGMRYEINFG